jgi:hypothetical protein
MCVQAVRFRTPVASSSVFMLLFITLTKKNQENQCLYFFQKRGEGQGVGFLCHKQ